MISTSRYKICNIKTGGAEKRRRKNAKQNAEHKRPQKKQNDNNKKVRRERRRTGNEKFSLVVFDRVGIAASAIRAVGSDSDFVEFAVATVFVVFAAANVTHNSVIDVFH